MPTYFPIVLVHFPCYHLFTCNCSVCRLIWIATTSSLVSAVVVHGACFLLVVSSLFAVVGAGTLAAVELFCVAKPVGLGT